MAVEERGGGAGALRANNSSPNDGELFHWSGYSDGARQFAVNTAVTVPEPSTCAVLAEWVARRDGADPAPLCLAPRGGQRRLNFWR